MECFKQWLNQYESNARQRAAINPGIPANAGLVFSSPPYSITAFCRKKTSPGVRLDNMNTDKLCEPQLVKSKKP